MMRYLLIAVLCVGCADQKEEPILTRDFVKDQLTNRVVSITKYEVRPDLVVRCQIGDDTQLFYVTVCNKELNGSLAFKVRLYDQIRSLLGEATDFRMWFFFPTTVASIYWSGDLLFKVDGKDMSLREWLIENDNVQDTLVY